ncbi:MAG: aldo/keto reductase [Micavibrio sp.]|nr:aldo/keto reductase [Micavibrio sp.]
MQKRQLGQSGLEVFPLCFGGNVFGWTIGEAQSFKMLDGFTGAGLNFIDTADIYSAWIPGNKGGESETIIGNWLNKGGKRQQVILATKVGHEFSPERKGLAKKYIIESVEGSLKKLQTDYIDLYQSHRDDETVPQEESLEAYEQLIKSGKVRAIGASNFRGDRLQSAVDAAKAKGLHSYQSLQPHYNLYERADYETTLEPVCVKNGIGVIPYYSLARGFLSGKYRSEADLGKSARGGSVGQNYLNDRGFRILKALDEVAAETSSNPAQVSLAWLMARPSITAPIASATKLEQLEDLVKSVSLKLPADAIKRLDVASAY